jgi:hypothetical protein
MAFRRETRSLGQRREEMSLGLRAAQSIPEQLRPSHWDFYIADVGQSTREEVNFEPASKVAGVNYGWRAREGTVDNPQVADPAPPGATDPIYDYGRTVGQSITGGYVYRGSAIPDLNGTYLFGDFVAGTFGSFRYSGGSLTELQDRSAELDPTNAFGNGSLSHLEKMARESSMP